MFWLLALPLKPGGSRGRTWELLQEKTSYGVQLSSNYKLDVPELRVGTLDTLLALSDDLVKVSAAVENVVAKIRRTVADMAGPGAVGSLKVENLPVESYLTRFKWDEPKFPLRRPLRETVDKIGEVMGHIEDDLKVGAGGCWVGARGWGRGVGVGGGRRRWLGVCSMPVAQVCEALACGIIGSGRERGVASRWHMTVRSSVGQLLQGYRRWRWQLSCLCFADVQA